MKRVRQYSKSPNNSIWLKNNPDAFVVTKSSLLGGLWNKVARFANENGGGVALLSNKDMVGVLVSVSLLNEFYDKIPHSKESDLVAHITEKEFRDGFDVCSKRLSSGENLIILDDNGKELLGIACKEFSAFLKIDKDGVAGYKKHCFDDCDSDKEKAFMNLSY